jgi:hypothetical protein
MKLKFRMILVGAMVLLLLLQMRTSLYIHDMEGSSFVNDLRMRVSRNLAILGVTEPDNVLDDLELSGATTASTVVVDARPNQPQEPQEQPSLSSNKDDSLEVDLVTLSSFTNKDHLSNTSASLATNTENGPEKMVFTYDSLTSADARLLESALGNKVSVDTFLPTWPAWMNKHSFVGFKPRAYKPMVQDSNKAAVSGSTFCLQDLPGGNGIFCTYISSFHTRILSAYVFIFCDVPGHQRLRLGVDESPRVLSNDVMTYFHIFVF